MAQTPFTPLLINSRLIGIFPYETVKLVVSSSPFINRLYLNEHNKRIIEKWVIINELIGSRVPFSVR
jgi:hypothetical protein